MSALHTPWSVREDRENPEHHGWFVVDSNNRAICWIRDEAVARLAAAAPELLEALEGFMTNRSVVAGLPLGAARARAAISNARGAA